MEDKNLQKCRNIGIMGGTFNPIHIGHLLMARWAKEFANLDAVLFIPTGNPYMKKDSEILNGETRLKMVELSIAGQEDFYVSDLEIKRSGFTYTCDTLIELKKMYPNAELYFIMGADSLYSFERWVQPDLILKNCILIAAARNNMGIEELKDKRNFLIQKFGGDIRLMKFPSIDISSTMIRERIKEGKCVRYMLDESVNTYIRENGFYR